MAPGDHLPPSRGSIGACVTPVCADSTSVSRPRIWLSCERLPTESRAIRLSSRRRFLPTRCSVAGSSRDVSDPTSGTPTLTPASVRGSLTSRLRD